MKTDLEQHIETTTLIDSHEHLHGEEDFVNNGPDVLADLFGMYIGDELIVAGAAYEAVVRLLDSSNPDIEVRWAGVEAAWELCRHGGYGEAVRSMAKLVYDIDEINLASIAGAAERNREIRAPGARLRLLRDLANLDHVQIDDGKWNGCADQSGPEFFLYDLSLVDFVSWQLDPNAVAQETGQSVSNLKTLGQAIDRWFEKYGPLAIAVKTQHAYERTLAWQPRDDQEAEKSLQAFFQGESFSKADGLCLGDWCLARGIENAQKYNLPIKIHTGYLAGHGQFFSEPDRTRAAHLAPLLASYPEATFVLFHIAYPYSDELMALAKHFPNAIIDMCWSWSINPRHAGEFVRRALHSLPLNKLFLFGGDCIWPTQTVGFAAQARRWFYLALQSEIEAGFLSEAEAINIATRLMQTNQRAVFDIDGKRRAIAAALAN